MEQVILVDEQDRPVGTAEKLAAHTDGGVLHRAFSVFVFDTTGRLLLQQRSSAKYHFALRWTNTCCGHPRPGEETAAAAARRLNEEMGISPALAHRRVLQYEATDDVSGLTEREVDHVFEATWEGTPNPDPSEVAAVRWAALDEIAKEIDAHPEQFTPWFLRILAER